MMSYEVTMVLEDESLAAALEMYMLEKHLDDVLASGCFVEGRFERGADGAYRTRYAIARQEDLDRYLAEHAPALRADFQEHFPDGLRISRAVWQELRRA